MVDSKIPEEPPVPTRSGEVKEIARQRYFHKLLKSKKGLSGLIITLMVILIAILAPVLAPASVTAQSIESKFAPPAIFGFNSDHIFGADNLGRDTFSRMVFGARISLGVALLVISLSVSLGSIVGAVAGYYGGVLDNVIMRVGDVQLSFPFILLALIFMAILGPGFWSMVVAFVVGTWVNYARLVRGKTLELREMEYVKIAKATGVHQFKIIFGHILPNAFPSVIVLGTLDFAWVIIYESALSFLGLGIQPPTPSWGVMLKEARNYLYESPWMTIFPGALLFVTCVGVNLLGDWLRDTFDPKLTRR